MTRIKCHSSFKHYEMFHSKSGGGNNYGSIFNTTYNINCKGHGGFWGGFGLGLGNAFGSLFSNWFGGGMSFGNFGMSGMSFPTFGGMNFGVPSFGNWFSSNQRVQDTDHSGKCECKKDKGKVTENKDNECKDPDRQKLVDYGAKVNEILSKTDLTPKELKTLYNQIKDAQDKSRTEAHHKDTDPKDYQNWLDVLKGEASKRNWGDIESNDFGTAPINHTPSTPPSPHVVTTPSSVVENPHKETGNIEDNRTKDLTPEKIKGLSNEEISKLTPEEATEALKKLGIEDGGVIKDANNIKVLLLLEKAGIDVKIAQNTDTTSVIDQWIQGKISGVQYKDGKISYSVDCTKHGSQKNKYNFVQKENGSNKYTITVKEFGKNAKYAKSDVISAEYTYDASKGYLTRNGYKFTTEL